MTAFAANYAVRKHIVDGIEVVRLSDAAHHAQIAVAPAIGNMAYEFLVNGKNVFWLPYPTLGELKDKPRFGGVPFLAPWANRLSQYSYYANGRKYELNRDLGNVRGDENQNPIHGLLNFSPYWRVTGAEAQPNGACMTSRLEFWKHPELMAQFPFAHDIEMTYCLRAGVLEVRTSLRNLSTDPMPVGIGYHPYFQLHDSPRDQWKVHFAARDHLVLSGKKIPTGEHKPIEFPDPLPLAGVFLDDVFSNLASPAVFSVEGAHERISVTYGPKYTVAVVFSPTGSSFICFEPMSAITDAFNLAQAGVYRDLQSIPPGEEWHESFWIAPTGF